MLILADKWWVFVLRGIAAVIFGILTFLLPGMALLTLVFLFGIYAIVDGILSFFIAARRRKSEKDRASWWALLISGALGVIAGIIAIVWPGITAIALLFVIAAWAIVTGVLAIAAAIRLRKYIAGEWLLALTGVLSIVVGVLLAVFPGPGALAVVLWIGAFMLAYGVMLIALGIRLRKWFHAHRTNADHPRDVFPTGIAPSH